jgi:pimeloyl-ACP methyl ester carboxylesterase
VKSLRPPIAAFAILLLVATACGTDGTGSAAASRRSEERPAAGDDPVLSEPSPGSLEWASCDDSAAQLAGLECAELTVPLDPADPDGATIDLALARLASTGSASERIGSLVINPGGPGGSGIEFLASAAAAFPAALVDRFDLVSFDPRGVGASTPVRCLDDAAKERQIQGDLSPDTQEEIDRAVADQAEFLAGCEANSPELLRHMSTADVAADLDEIREAVGDEQLNYLGYSYGTEIGAVYATLFPEQARALVLDGAVSPTATADEQTMTQALGFEHTLANFVASCNADPSCPLGPDAAASIAATRAALDAQPVQVTTPSGTRTLGVDLFDIGLATALYDTSLWNTAAEAIATVDSSGGTVILSLVDRQLGRQPDGSYDNSNDAQAMVSCADTTERPTVDEGAATAARIAAAAPTFGPALGWGSLGCLGWPLAANPLPELTGAGAPPILVIGTLGDPATPYEWSEQMASALESGVLLTYEGDGHTAFLRGGACIEDAVVDYLVDLDVPDEGERCPVEAGATGTGSIRDQLVAELEKAGLNAALAECVIDGVVDKVGSAELDRMILEQDLDELAPLIQAQTLNCASVKGG